MHFCPFFAFCPFLHFCFFHDILKSNIQKKSIGGVQEIIFVYRKAVQEIIFVFSRNSGSRRRLSLSKAFVLPRTKSLSKNSPIIRRCSLQEDQSLLAFQSLNPTLRTLTNGDYARRKSLDIIEIREDVINEEGSFFCDKHKKLFYNVESTFYEKKIKNYKL